jgi:predicted ABC-type sugar transport system permease subunit
MNAGLIGLVVVLVLLGGTLMGVAALFLVPIVGALVIVALLIWLLRRRAAHKPPVP